MMIGDMAIKDLTPKTTNIGDRLVKNMRICGSGIYTYHRSEAQLMGLSDVDKYIGDAQYFNVFRPPQVLIDNREKFARVPIITGAHQVVHRENAKQLTVGLVGDTVDYEVDKDDGETYLYTTGTIIAGDGVDAYNDFGQLSVGYDPVVQWSSGEHNGVPYHATLMGFNDVNHLLICKTARGGPQCMIMDSLDNSPTKNKDGGHMNFFQKIFGSKPKQVVGDSGVVPVLLQSLAKGGDPKVQVPIIRSIVGDSDATWNEYLDELEAVDLTKVDMKTLGDAVDVVQEYYMEHIVGDTGNPDPDDGGKSEPKGSEGTDDEGMPGDAKDGPEKDEPKKDMPGDAIDYDKLADKLAERMTKKVEPQVDITPVVVGDSGAAGTSITSDDYIKQIWG